MTTTFKDTSSQITVKFNISERIDQHNDNTSVQLPGIFNVIKLHVQQRNIYKYTVFGFVTENRKHKQ